MQWVNAIDAWLVAAAAQWWVYPALYLLTVADAFLVVLPSEITLAALASLGAASGRPLLWLLVPVAALGALSGDLACYGIGRAAGLERWRWQREGRTGAAIARIRDVATRRTAVLIFTARYIPFARIAVNLSVGAARLPIRRYLPLAATAGLCWALYNVLIGTAFGSVLRDQPVLAVLCSIVVATLLGVLVDRVIAGATARLSARRGRAAAPAPEAAPSDGPPPPSAATGSETPADLP